MKNLFFIILCLATNVNATIVPSKFNNTAVKDELFPYQWGLQNHGQVLIKEKTDIKNIQINGLIDADINWIDLQRSTLPRRPVIAVLDTGVDLAHPELQGNLWKNTEECGKDSSVDNDNNQLPGDCDGWNFTADIKSQEAKNPNDIDGHGTHVAGIIASLKNESGIVGVLPNSLIMPVKVIRDHSSNNKVSVAESFARGIYYAVNNGADVINMSLGWPRSLETKSLRDAVYYALSKGVPIVAAAGNNSTTEPLFPCAYEGVICVSASSVDGKFAGFSNYGGHIDVSAPGENILSLNPTLIEPDFFSVPGFEIRNGTSQSAPFVAAMVAALKVQNKDITLDEIFARIYSSPRSIDPKKFILGGDIKWDSLKNSPQTPVIVPIFKRVRQIVLRGDNAEGKLVIPIKNYSLPSSNFTIEAKILSPSLFIKNNKIEIDSLKTSEIKELSFDVFSDNIYAESIIKIQVDITDKNTTHSYINEIPVVRDIRNLSKFKSLDFKFQDKPIPLGTIKEGNIVSFLSTLDSYPTSADHEFFMRRTITEGENKFLEITLFRRINNEFKQAPKLIKIPGASTLVNFTRADINQDGSLDYVIHTITEEGSGDNIKKHFTFHYFSKDIEPLWNSLQGLKVNIESYFETMNDIFFLKINHPTLGKILTPAFFSKGQLPKHDQTISSWDKYDPSVTNHIYYLKDEDSEYKIHSLTTNTWKEKLREELKISWFENILVENILPLTSDDRSKGSVRAVVSAGFSSKRQIFIHSFNPSLIERGPKLPQLVLQTEFIRPVLSITSSGITSSGTAFFNVYDRSRAKLVTATKLHQEENINLNYKSDFDVVAGHLATFTNEAGKFTVYHTRDNLISFHHDNSKKQSSRQKLRFSFLSSDQLLEMYLPISYSRDNSQGPALYVDSSAITGNRIYVLEESNGSLVSSIKNSLIIPPGCKALNPSFNLEDQGYEFIFLCLERNQWSIKSYPVE